jgi:hypothetical protein
MKGIRAFPAVLQALESFSKAWRRLCMAEVRGSDPLLMLLSPLPPYRSLTTKPPELRFHALLSNGTREVRFARVGTC